MSGGLTKRTFRIISAVVALFTLGVGSAIPILDVAALEARSGIESDHQHAGHVAQHDHSICVQFGNQRWSNRTMQLGATHSPDEVYLLGHPDEAAHSTDVARPGGPRAPPLGLIL